MCGEFFDIFQALSFSSLLFVCLVLASIRTYRNSLFLPTDNLAGSYCRCIVVFSIRNLDLIVNLANVWVWDRPSPVPSMTLSDHLFLWRRFFLIVPLLLGCTSSHRTIWVCGYTTAASSILWWYFNFSSL